MKAFKPILNALICITFSSCLYTENSDLYTDTELNEDGDEWKLHQCELTELLYLAWLYN